jgi:hypothetical protein
MYPRDVTLKFALTSVFSSSSSSSTYVDQVASRTSKEANETKKKYEKETRNEIDSFKKLNSIDDNHVAHVLRTLPFKCIIQGLDKSRSYTNFVYDRLITIEQGTFTIELVFCQCISLLCAQ